MTIAKRTFGQPASLPHLMKGGKEFTDTAMRLDIKRVLAASKHQRRVGLTAARLSGIDLQHEGNGDAKRLVSAAYDTIYDLMRPSLAQHGADATVELFATPTTRNTLRNLSESVSSYGVSTIAYHYGNAGNYLQLTQDGLEIDNNHPIPKEFSATRGGCPYAKSERATYFNRFTDRIVETYAEAHRNNMPHGWLEATSRLFLKR